MGYHFLWNGDPKYTGAHKFLERKIGGHTISDDQNVGSHKMTTDRLVFILFKKKRFQYNFRGSKNFVAKKGVSQVYLVLQGYSLLLQNSSQIT